MQPLRHLIHPLVLAGVLLGASSPARAQICVELDRDADSLDPQDARAVLRLVEGEFRKQGEEVVQPPCSESYSLYNIQLGKSVQASISGPLGHREGRVRTIEDLPRIYSQMIGSLLTGTPMTNDGANDRYSVTTEQAAPLRVAADVFWYGRIGGGSVLGGDSNFGPTFGVGYRYELDRFGIDASANGYLGLEEDKLAESFDAGGALSAKLMGLYFFSGRANSSAYIGAGLGYGISGVTDSERSFGGFGLQGEVSAGFEILRASTIRMFIQADASLPFYLSAEDIEVDSDDRYTPTLGLSLGFAFGESNTSNVNVN